MVIHQHHACSVKKYKQLFYILLKHEFHAHYHIMILIKSPWGFRKKSEQVAPLLQFDCRISILWNLLAWLCYEVSLRDHFTGNSFQPKPFCLHLQCCSGLSILRIGTTSLSQIKIVRLILLLLVSAKVSCQEEKLNENRRGMSLTWRREAETDKSLEGAHV